MTAAEHLSPRQFPKYQPAIEPGQQLPMFMTPHEIGGMMAADFDGHMRDVPKQMRNAYAHQAEKVALHGHTPGPSKLDRVSEQVEAEGGIHTPVKVTHLPSGVASLYDGHHRSVTALEHGSRLVPVEHYFDHQSAMDAIVRDNTAAMKTARLRRGDTQKVWE
jgi:hypothetical protein